MVSDEIYHGLVYGEKEHSILEFTDRAFVLNGFSKAYAMTGWRLGYLIAPTRIRAAPAEDPAEFLYLGREHQPVGRGGGAPGGGSGRGEDALPSTTRRRKYMIGRLRELGFGLPVEPSGAFYILVNAKHLSEDSYRLAFEILEEAGSRRHAGDRFRQKTRKGICASPTPTPWTTSGRGSGRIEEYLKQEGEKVRRLRR